MIDLTPYNQRTHHRKSVKCWVADRRQEVEVFYLPKFSPEWKASALDDTDLAQAITTMTPERIERRLVKATVRYLRRCQPQREQIQATFDRRNPRHFADVQGQIWLAGLQRPV